MRVVALAVLLATQAAERRAVPSKVHVEPLMRRYILGLEGSGTRMVARAIANKLARDGVAMSLNGVWDGETPPCWRRLIGAQSAVTPEGSNTKGVPFETVEHISLPWGLPCGSPILTTPFVDMCRPSTLSRRGRAGGGLLEPAPAQRPIELPPAHPDAHTPGVPINRRTVRFFANVTEILLRNPRSRAIVMTRESAFTIASTIQTRCQSFPKLAIKESHHAKRLVRHALEVVPKQIMVVPMDTLPWLSEYYWKRMCKFMLLPPPCDQVPAQVHWRDANLRWLRANPRVRNFTQDDVS